MPFEVFRRHQRKLLAVLAIFAMVAFTLDFSLFRNYGGGAGENPVVFTLYGEPVLRSEVNRMKLERLHANRFMSQISGREEFFGGIEDNDIRDALILEHEANRLKMPATEELAKLWLNEVTGGQLTPQDFDLIYRQSFNQEPYLITDEQLLAEIANQVRISQVFSLPGLPGATLSQVDLSAITPLDIYQAYRDQFETVKAHVVAFPVEEFVDQVPDPTDAQVQAYYDKYKDELPDPNRETPGFKIPRRVRVEYVKVDQSALVDRFEKELTEEEVRKHYDENKERFPAPKPELPTDLFAGADELTPHETDPYAELRDQVRSDLAQQRAEEEVDRIFEEVRREVMDPFIDRYAKAEERNLTAEEEGKAAEPLPQPTDEDGKTLLTSFAEQKHLEHEVTPLLNREEAAMRVGIADAAYGDTFSITGPRFADYVFQPRLPVFASFKLADPRGNRYLGWKIADEEPKVPPLKEIREQVVHAWKMEQARELAEKAARTLAEKAAGADLLTVAEGRRVEPIAEVPKLAPSLDFNNPATFNQLRPTELPPLQNPGEALRDLVYNLEKGEVEVAPNAPKTVYYVLALREPRPEGALAGQLNELFNPLGVRPRLEQRVAVEGSVERYRRWLDFLRKQAGVEVAETASADDEA